MSANLSRRHIWYGDIKQYWLSVSLSAAYIASNLKIASRKKFKFCRNIAQDTCDSWTCLELVKRS